MNHTTIIRENGNAAHQIAPAGETRPRSVRRWVRRTGLLAAGIACALMTVTTAVHAQSTTGLAAHWRFDDGSGTAASDASGRGNAGTLRNGPTWGQGKVGSALRFDGVDDYVEVRNSLHLGSGDFTLEAWIVGDPAMEGYGRIIDKGYASGYALGNQSGTRKIMFEYLRGPWLVTKSDVIDNTWHHIAVVKAGTTATIYADGKAENSVTVSSAAENNTLPLFIGYNPGEGQQGHWKGFIDEVRLYTRALSATEIQSDAGAGTGTGTTPTTTATVRTVKASYAANESIVVEFANLPGNPSDWVSLAKQGAPTDQYEAGRWAYTNGERSGSRTFTSLPAGQYEARVYFNWPTGGTTIQARYAFTVGGTSVSAGNFAGVWWTDLGFYMGFVQNGASVTGYFYSNEQWYPLLTGTVTGNALKGRWDLGVADGTFEFTLATDTTGKRIFQAQATGLYGWVEIQFTGYFSN